MSDPWMMHMRRGEFDAAWEIGDALLRFRAGLPCHGLPRHLQHIWNGDPLHGKRILIRCYHGRGDTIQFIRYGPLMQAIAREVMVRAQPALIPLLRTARGIDHILWGHNRERMPFWSGCMMSGPICRPIG